MRRVALLALALLLAGCADPGPAPDTLSPSMAPTTPPRYDLTVRISAETADGQPLPGAEVVAFPLDAEGRPGPAGLPATADTQGVARFSFREPTRLALRATLPGWTAEGTTVAVGDRVTAGDGLVASERDVFLPLYRSELRFAAGATLMTQAVAAGADGALQRPATVVGLAMPDRAGAAYLARLAAAEVRLSWADTATQRADLSAGLAWDGRVWVEGEPGGPAVLPGDRSATFAGTLPAEGRPADLGAATLQAAAVTNSAVVGDVPVAAEVVLRFAGHVPAGLPVACHSVASVCALPLPP